MSDQSKANSNTSSQFGASANPVRKFKKAQDWQDRSAPFSQRREFPAGRPS